MPSYLVAFFLAIAFLVRFLGPHCDLTQGRLLTMARLADRADDVCGDDCLRISRMAH